MPYYRVIVVGTDGSEASLEAVDRAASIAAGTDATLVVAMAYVMGQRDPAATGSEPRQADRGRNTGDAPVDELLRDAADRAERIGATNVVIRAVEGSPADALVTLADEVNADLIVVGSARGRSLLGKLLGSVPRTLQRRAKTEVLVVPIRGR